MRYRVSLYNRIWCTTERRFVSLNDYKKPPRLLHAKRVRAIFAIVVGYYKRCSYNTVIFASMTGRWLIKEFHNAIRTYTRRGV